MGFTYEGTFVYRITVNTVLGMYGKQILLVILTDLLMFSNNALKTAVYKYGILTYVNHLNQYIIVNLKRF